MIQKGWSLWVCIRGLTTSTCNMTGTTNLAKSTLKATCQLAAILQETCYHKTLPRPKYVGPRSAAGKITGMRTWVHSLSSAVSLFAFPCSVIVFQLYFYKVQMCLTRRACAPTLLSACQSVWSYSVCCILLSMFCILSPLLIFLPRFHLHPFSLPIVIRFLGPGYIFGSIHISCIFPTGPAIFTYNHTFHAIFTVPWSSWFLDHRTQRAHCAQRWTSVSHLKVELKPKTRRKSVSDSQEETGRNESEWCRPASSTYSTLFGKMIAAILFCRLIWESYIAVNVEAILVDRVALAGTFTPSQIHRCGHSLLNKQKSQQAKQAHNLSRSYCKACVSF